MSDPLTDKFTASWKAAELRNAQATGFDTAEAWRADQQAKAAAIVEAEKQRKADARAKFQATLEAKAAAELAEAQSHGFATTEEYHDDMRQKMQAAKRKGEVARFIQAAGMPPRHLAAIENGDELTPQQAAIASQALKMLRGGAIMALIGKRGTGKTFVAACLVRQFCEATLQTARYTKAMDYFRDIKNTFSRESEKTERQVCEEYQRYGLLILDEAHERSGSDWELTQLTDLLDSRYAAMRPTLLICNLTRAALAESLGASICSRLREDGDVLELAGESFREIIRAERTAK